MLLMIQDTSVWERIADRYGIFAVILVVIGIGLWKGLFPFVKAQIETTQRAMADQVQRAERLAEQTQSARERALSEFLTALERRDQKFSEVVDVLEKLATEVRRGKK